MSLAGAGATCPGGPGPVLVSASDHQHLTPPSHGGCVHREVLTLVILKIRRDMRHGAESLVSKLLCFSFVYFCIHFSFLMSVC